MYQDIDYEKLRRDLIDYYGTASQIFPMSIMEISKVERATPNQLIELANKNGFNISDYEINNKKRYLR